MFYCLLIPIDLEKNSFFLAYVQPHNENDRWCQTSLETTYQSRWENLLLFYSQSEINKQLKNLNFDINTKKMYFWFCDDLPKDMQDIISTSTSLDPVSNRMFDINYYLITEKENDLLEKISQNSSSVIYKEYNELHDGKNWKKNPFPEPNISPRKNFPIKYLRTGASAQFQVAEIDQTPHGGEPAKSRNQSDFKKEFEKNLKNLQIFYDLIRSQNSLDSPVIAAMKEKIGVLESDVERFKPSGIDSKETNADPHHSIRIHEKDLMDLYRLATRVHNNGEPLITHCTEGSDRAARTALAIDLFLHFDEIFQESETQPIDAIISNLRSKGAPGALSNIKQYQETLYFVYAFKAIDVYELALQQLQTKYSEAQQDFFDELENFPSTDAKIDHIKHFLDENNKNQLKEAEKNDFILFEKILREQRLAERACLWEINPHLFLNLSGCSNTELFATWNAEQQKIIDEAKRVYMRSMLLEDYVVTLQRNLMSNVTNSAPMRPALIATDIIHTNLSDIKKIAPLMTSTNPIIDRADEEAESKEQHDKCNENKKGKEKIDSLTELVTTAEKSQHLFTTENLITEEYKKQILNSIAQHQNKIGDKYDELLDKIKQVSETKIKSLNQSLNEQVDRTLSSLAGYIYNRTHRNKKIAILSFDLFASPSLFKQNDNDKKLIFSALITLGKQYYDATKNNASDLTDQTSISDQKPTKLENKIEESEGKTSPASVSDQQLMTELKDKIENLDPFTQKKLKDALCLIGNLCEKRDKLFKSFDEKMVNLIDGIQPEYLIQQEFLKGLKDKINKITETMTAELNQELSNISNIIKQHRKDNNKFESEKFFNKHVNQVFPCLRKNDFNWTLNQSHYEWVLADAAGRFNPPSPSLENNGEKASTLNTTPSPS